MPRMTSFDSHEAVPQVADEWKVFDTPRKGILSPKEGIATRRDTTIQLQFDGGSSCSIECISYCYLVKMVLKERTLEFTIFPMSGLTTNGHRLHPEVLTIRNDASRFEIVAKDFGKAVYRPAWKDSDEAKGIKGFIDTTGFSSTKTEEAFVWLLGTLIIRGMPFVEVRSFPVA